jgi:vitamin B12 transporter
LVSPRRARLGCVFAIVVLSLLAPHSARADAELARDAGASLVGETLEIPVVAETKARAAASTVIDLERFAGEQNSVAELLAASPGTTVRSTGGPLQPTTVSLRGASPDESLILLDGIPLHGPGGGAFDLSQIPAQLVSQLVVHRGVLGAQLGAGALGGAIEVIPRGVSEEPHGGVRGSFGSFTTAQLALDGSAGKGGPLEGATFGLQLDRTHGDFHYLHAPTPNLPNGPLYDETRENDDGKRLAFLLREEKPLGAGTVLELIAIGSFGNNGQPGTAYNPTLTERVDDQGGVFGVRMKTAIGPGVASARAWLQANRIVLSGVGGSGFGTCAPGTSDPTCAAMENHSLAARGSGEVAFPLGASNWATASIEAGEDWSAGAGEGIHRRGVGSLALRDELTLLSGKLAFLPAVRIDVVGAEVAASPALGISALPFSGALAPLELRASAGTSFRAPTFSELYLQQGGTDPNPMLHPERAGSLEVGAQLRTSQLTLGASIFLSRYSDLILYEPDSAVRQKAYNIGFAIIRGAELEALVPLPLGFSAEANWSYLSATNESSGALVNGQPLPYRPSHRVFARVARKGDRLEGFASLQYSSSMPRNEAATTFLDAQAAIDCGLGARVLGPLWVDLEVKNLLDQERQQDLFQYPLPGVSFTAIARARF